MSDRRPPGIGVYRRQWGKRSTLNLAQFPASIFGGGPPPQGAAVLPVPTPRAGGAPTAHAGHLGNMLAVTRAILGGGIGGGLRLSEEDEGLLRSFEGAEEGAKQLLAALCTACHPMCGEVEYSCCRF